MGCHHRQVRGLMEYSDWDYDYLEYVDSEYGIYWEDYDDYVPDVRWEM